MGSIYYTPPADLSEELLFHSSGHALLVGSFSYTPRTGFSDEFLLHSSSWFSEAFVLHS